MLFSCVNRFKRAFNRYGLLLPIHYANYCADKATFKRFAIEIGCFKESQFAIKRHFHENLYRGDSKRDSSLILKGQRKVLFYQGEEGKRNDIKYQWEINRFHHLLPVAVEFAKTRDPKLSSFIKKEIIDYSKSSYLLNTNAMEISISLINLIYSSQVADCRDTCLLDALNSIIKKSLFYILSNIEKGIVYSNNHYFFDLLGIEWVLSELENAHLFNKLKLYVDKCLLQLLNQIISADGSLYEGSTYYSRYVTESLLWYVFVHKEEREMFQVVLARMVDFLYGASDNHVLFGFGDNDSGRLLPVPFYFDYNSRSLAVIDLLCERMGFIQTSFRDCSYYCDFGLAVVRTNDFAIALRADSIRDKKKNKCIGSHYHNDQLSVQINFQGENVLIDPGTYLYTFENQRRISNMKTEAHNTLCVSCVEQNDIFNNWHYVERKAIAELISETQNEMKATLVYSGIKHERTILIKDDNVEIIDKFEGMQPHRLNFMFSPRFDVCCKNKSLVEARNNNIYIDVDSEGEMVLQKSYCALEYGENQETHTICISFNKEVSTKFSFYRLGEQHE